MNSVNIDQNTNTVSLNQNTNTLIVETINVRDETYFISGCFPARFVKEVSSG